jgi:hypothetical protein
MKLEHYPFGKGQFPDAYFKNVLMVKPNIFAYKPKLDKVKTFDYLINLYPLIHVEECHNAYDASINHHIVFQVEDYILDIYYADLGSNQHVFQIIEGLNNADLLFVEKDDLTTHRVNIIAEGEYRELVLKPFDCKDYNVSVEENYNDDFKDIYLSLIDQLGSDEKGFFILHGDPGTGKTKLINHLIKSVDKKFIYLPSHMVQVMASPKFIPFLSKIRDCVLIIEDAESILFEAGLRNESTSNLLNLTDGLLADQLNLKIICTFNADISQIDKALLRKGRLSLKYKFESLSLDKTNKLLNKLDIDFESKTGMNLSDIYNFSSDNGVKLSTKKPIGF